jgi:hypothetical protein
MNLKKSWAEFFRPTPPLAKPLISFYSPKKTSIAPPPAQKSLKWLMS